MMEIHQYCNCPMKQTFTYENAFQVYCRALSSTNYEREKSESSAGGCGDGED